MRSPLLILLLPLASAHLLPRRDYNGHGYNDTPNLEVSPEGEAEGNAVQLSTASPVSSSIATPSLETTDPLLPGTIFGISEDSDDCEDDSGDPSTSSATYYTPPETEDKPSPEPPATNSNSRNWNSDIAQETDNRQSSIAPQVTTWSAKTFDMRPVSSKVVSRSVLSSSHDDEAETSAPTENSTPAEPEAEESPEDNEQNGNDAQEQFSPPEEKKEQSSESPSPSPTSKEPETVEQTVFIAYTSEAGGKQEFTTKVVTMSTAVPNKDEHPIEDVTITLNDLPTPTVSPTLRNKDADNAEEPEEGQATWITMAAIPHTENNGAVSTEYLPTTIYIPQSNWDTRLWTTSTPESSPSPTSISMGSSSNPKSSSPAQKETTVFNTVLESLSKDPQVTIVQTLPPSTSADSAGSASTVVQQVILFSAGQSVTTAVSTSTVEPSPSPTGEEEFSLADDPNAGSRLRVRSRSAPQNGVMAYIPNDPLFWGAMLAVTAGIGMMGGDAMVLLEIGGLMVGILGVVLVVASHPEVAERLAEEGVEMGTRCVATLENIWHI